MPRTRSLAWAELKIGLISIFAIVMTLTLIFLLSGEGGFSWQQYELRTRFDNIAGLKPGAPVRVAGVEVGNVSATRFDGDRVDVAMKVNEKYRPLITSESVAVLGSVSLLGESRGGLRQVRKADRIAGRRNQQGDRGHRAVDCGAR
jgi:phospholipid/cholesterol/gamma-HCH transport system substrate-binding protein